MVEGVAQPAGTPVVVAAEVVVIPGEDVVVDGPAGVVKVVRTAVVVVVVVVVLVVVVVPRRHWLAISTDQKSTETFQQGYVRIIRVQLRANRTGDTGCETVSGASKSTLGCLLVPPVHPVPPH